MSKHPDIKIALIVAMASNRVIGRDNQLPWHLPNDLKYFKATTLGKPVVMGRKTYESIGRPLPGRTNIVVTTNRAFRPEGVEVVHSVDEGLDLAQRVAKADGVEELMVIGGAQLYEAVMPQVDRLYVTQVHAIVEGDALFPELEFSQWQELSCERHKAGDNNPYDYSFIAYQRRR